MAKQTVRWHASRILIHVIDTTGDFLKTWGTGETRSHVLGLHHTNLQQLGHDGGALRYCKVGTTVMRQRLARRWKT